MYLYPRLPKYIAPILAKNRAAKSLDELRRLSAVEHGAAWYAPTGGNRVDKERLKQIQGMIQDCADRFEYPNGIDVSTRQKFDAECAVILHQNMGITPSEAANLEVWTFMTCIMLPDIVRWRFPGDQSRTNVERFIGSARGLRRNAFGRLWWRAYLLCQPSADEPYWLVEQLNEDELVQITERPSLAGSPVLAQQICTSFLTASELCPDVPRRELLRDTVKRLRRLLPILSFDVMDEELLQRTVDQMFLDAALSLNQE